MVPSGNGGGGDELPVAGEIGGACFTDGTCKQGLECMDDVCVEVVGEEETLIIFHNDSGPMCLAALEWLGDVQSEHPALVIEEHLTYEAGEYELLLQLELPFEASQGVSTSFEFLPIIFFQDHAFSGFDDGVAEALEELLLSATGIAP
jgi:hypothetical protein